MMRVETAVIILFEHGKFFARADGFNQKRLKLLAVCSASVRVNNRCGCSGCSSRSSSWSSGILFRPFQGQLKTYRKDSMRWSRSLA